MEQDLWQHYATVRPGEVQVLGADLFNGSPTSVNQFRITTGATFPLLLQGAAGVGNENLFIPYGDRDSYAVINKQGIVRYQAYDRWPYGNRYHLDELRGCIDSLVSGLVSVPPTGSTATPELTVTPNPSRARPTIALALPGERAVEASVAVFDVRGRLVSRPWRGVVGPGVTRVPWGGTGETVPLVPGVYLVRAKVGGTSLTKRLVSIGP